MLLPDDQLAVDILDALDLRDDLEPYPILNELGCDERGRIEQQRQMIEALLNWLKRWMQNPRYECLRVEKHPLWRTVATLFDHLALSQCQLLQQIEEFDEATECVLQALAIGQPAIGATVSP
jgi:hypothetical protein